MNLTQREKMIIRLESKYQITIIFNTNNQKEKAVLCNRCKEIMAFFDIVIDEHYEFECCYCGKNVKLPAYIWDDDIYQFPNDFYQESFNLTVKAKCLAQAYTIAYNLNKKILMQKIEDDQ